MDQEQQELDPDEIRKKRLERLERQSKNKPGASKGTGGITEKKQEKGKFEPKPLLQTTLEQISKPSLITTCKSNTSDNSISTPNPTNGATNNAAQQFAALSEESWEISICESVLGVTVSEGQSNLLRLDTLIMEEGSDFLMISENWDKILYARCAMQENNQPEMPTLFDFLVTAWAKLYVRHSNIIKLTNDIKLVEIATKRCKKLVEFQDIVMNYIGLVIHPEHNDMFPQNHGHGAGYFGFRLTSLSDPESFFPRHFMDAFISKFAEEGLTEIFAATVNNILTTIRTKFIYDDYQSCFRAMIYLISFKSLADILTVLPNWNPDYVNARTLETMTILGPFFSRTSIFPDTDPNLPLHYFGSSGIFNESLDVEHGVGTRNFTDVKSSKQALQDTATIVQNMLYTLVHALVKSGPVAKENVLKFLARAVNLNKKRSQMQVNRAQVSSDGFMHNILEVCKLFCNPILDPTFSKLKLIDIERFAYDSRFDFSEETRINCTSEECVQLTQTWLKKNTSRGNVNFVTDIFFMTLAHHHYGLLSSMRYYKNFMKELQEMQRTNDRYVHARDGGEWEAMDPLTRSSNEQGLQRFQNEVDKLIGVRLAMEAGLMNEPLLEQTIRFYDLTMLVLIRCAGGNSNLDWNRVARGETQGAVLFPLPQEQAKDFIVLPEWIIDDICEFYTFLLKRKPSIFENKARDEFMAFSMVILSNSSYVKNPYLKSKLIEILFYFTLPLWRLPNGETRGRLDTPFIAHPFAKEYLVSSILQFYVDVEQTGMSSQFYDKFNIRYNISQILKSIWTDSGHRSKVVALGKNAEFFVKFVNLLMNDTTFLLDEGLSKLKEIGVIQTELSVPLQSQSQPDQTARREREQSLAEAERRASSYISLAKETLHLMNLLTSQSDTVEPFMATEVVDRLAAMLDINLVALAGPRCTDLKVANPEKYSFDAKYLLGELTDIFVHLSHRPEFIVSVAKDQRSYSKVLFLGAIGILSRHNLKNEADLEKLSLFVGAVEEAIKATISEEAILGEIPDEFLDPLLSELMKDPVLLPSGHTLDRSTISTHLLSDPTDPFNRQPLTIDQVVPNVELLRRLTEWKNSKMAK